MWFSAITIALPLSLLLLPPGSRIVKAAPIKQYSGGLLVYADGTAGTPKYQTFDDTNGFGSEQSATSVGSAAINWIRVVASPTKDEWIIATKDSAATNNVIKVQVCTGVEGGVSCGSTTTISSAQGTTAFRNFDVAYEQTSGDALVVYGTSTADELRKIEWTGGSWTSDASITTTRTSGTVEWVELTSRSSSNEIGIAYADSNDDISAYRWSGSAVGDEATAAITTTANAGDCRKMDVSFEGSSGDMIVVGYQSTAAGTIAFGTLSGTTWTISTDTTVDIATDCVDIAEPSSGSDRTSIAAFDSLAASNVGEFASWSGSAITDGPDIAAGNMAVWAANYQLAATSYASSTNVGVAVYSLGTATDDIAWGTMNSSGTWTTQTTNTRTRGAGRFIDLFDYPNTDKVLLFTSDANSDLWADTWDTSTTGASAWTDKTSGGALETSLSTATKDVVDFAFKLATDADLTWDTSAADYEIWDSSSVTWDAGQLICGATLTDTNGNTVSCGGGAVSASHTYRVQVVLKNSGATIADMTGSSDFIDDKIVKTGWGGTTPTISASSDCGFNDLGSDDGSTTCNVAFNGNDVRVTNTGAGSVKIANNGTEGFMYKITTDSSVPTSDSQSYMDSSIDAITEDSSKITINSVPTTDLCMRHCNWFNGGAEKSFFWANFILPSALPAKVFNLLRRRKVSTISQL